MLIRKRDGRIRNFDESRIDNAIRLSISDYNRKHTNNVIDHVDIVAKEIMQNVINVIVLKIDSKVREEGIIDVESVQDIVVTSMIKYNKALGAEYASYRAERERERINRHYIKLKEEILDTVSTENSNANVDENNFGGKELRIVETATEAMADAMLPKHIAVLSKKGRILKQHDYCKWVEGMHNCLLPDYVKLLDEGFSTRQADTKTANSFLAAMQLIPVIIQSQSLEQFGGVGLVNFSVYMTKYLRKSIAQKFKMVVGMKLDEDENAIERYFKEFPEYDVKEMTTSKAITGLEGFGNGAIKTFDKLISKEVRQGCQSLITNLVTLQSRSGHQLPFSSLNIGLIDPESPEESEAIIVGMLNELNVGIGKKGRVAIFPITCFQVKSGINRNPGDPYYHLRMLAQLVAHNRLFPTFVNCDFSVNQASCMDEEMNLMGCRTLMVYNRITGDYRKTGRGNNAPCTLNLPYVAAKAFMEDKLTDEEFFKTFEYYIDCAKESLMLRYEIMAENKPSVAPFMYSNETILGAAEARKSGKCREALKHGSMAIGYIGVAEMCKIRFGKYHCELPEAQEFALKVIGMIYDKCKQFSEEENLNFGVYATPAEGFCSKARDIVFKDFGEIEGVTDKEYITNSHHCPVKCGTPLVKKVEIESAFATMATAGNIFHIEVEGRDYNEAAMTKMLDMALDADIPYIRFSHPVSTCMECGHRLGALMETCEKCGSGNVENLAVVTGYLSSDYRFMNKGKVDEVLTRELNQI